MEAALRLLLPKVLADLTFEIYPQLPTRNLAWHG